jgi:hypothetical protein
MVSLLASSKSQECEVVINLLHEVGNTFVRTKVQLAAQEKGSSISMKS